MLGDIALYWHGWFGDCTGRADAPTAVGRRVHRGVLILSMSVTHKQPWNLGGAASEAAVGRSQEKSLELFGAQSQGS